MGDGQAELSAGGRWNTARCTACSGLRRGISDNFVVGSLQHLQHVGDMFRADDDDRVLVVEVAAFSDYHLAMRVHVDRNLPLLPNDDVLVARPVEGFRAAGDRDRCVK